MSTGGSAVEMLGTYTGIRMIKVKTAVATEKAGTLDPV
jgi:hypothetical protein